MVEQVIRPTGLLDPVIEVSPARGQVPHLLEQIRERAAVGERVLVTTLTKRLAEDLSFYLSEQGVRCKWLHSELDAFERVELLRDLRKGQFEALVGVNLLREGLDLPEVSLVAILDADKEGFLRSETSLMQTIGRAARNVNAKVILYADTVTDSMQHAIDETRRRRDAAGGVQPRARHHARDDSKRRSAPASKPKPPPMPRPTPPWAAPTKRSTSPRNTSPSWKPRCTPPPRRLEFERAAAIRDRITKMRDSIGQAGRRSRFQSRHERRRKTPPSRAWRAAAAAEKVVLPRMARPYWSGRRGELRWQKRQSDRHGRAMVPARFTGSERSARRSVDWQNRAYLIAPQNPKRNTGARGAASLSPRHRRRFDR